MTFQAYLDTIKEKTGLGPADFRALAEQKGLLAGGVTAGPIVAWLADDYGLGRGHAMAIVATLKPGRPQDADPASAVDDFFTGPRAAWRSTFDDLLRQVEQFGAVGIARTTGYLSLTKGSGKFAVVAATADRLDIGIKLKGVEPTERFEPAGSWNSMVTHRVRVTEPAQIDTQLLNWLRDAYAAA